jgi:lipopolysaccharide export system permease protein
MLTILDRYLAVRLLKAIAGATVSVTALFIFIDLTTHRREDILEKAIPLNVVAEYYLLLIPSLLREYQIAALAVLVSFLVVFGRASQAREITAMLASGIGLRRFIRVPAVVAASLAVAVFLLSETLGVAAASRAASIEVDYFGDLNTVQPNGVSWANLEGGWTCHIAKFNLAAGTGTQVFMLKFQPDRLEQIDAKRIVWVPETSTWNLEDGSWSIYYPDETMAVETRTFDVERAPVKETVDALFLDEIDSSTLSLSKLHRNIEEARARHVPTQRSEVDWNSRFAQPVLAFIMMWIAVPFGIQLGRGGIAVGLATSFGIALAYLMVYAAAIGMGYIGRIQPWVAAWLANAAFAVIAAVLMKRTVT